MSIHGPFEKPFRRLNQNGGGMNRAARRALTKQQKRATHWNPRGWLMRVAALFWGYRK